jgi:hypothetical protein
VKSQRKKAPRSPRVLQGGAHAGRRFWHVLFESHRPVPARDSVPRADSGHQLDQRRRGERFPRAIEQVCGGDLGLLVVGPLRSQEGQLACERDGKPLGLAEAAEFTGRKRVQLGFAGAVLQRGYASVARGVQAVVVNRDLNGDEFRDPLIERAGAPRPSEETAGMRSGRPERSPAPSRC